MSFAALQARLTMLISMQYDIELQTQFIFQHRQYLSNLIGGMVNMKADYEPNSSHERVLQARIHQLSEAEKILEARYENLQNRLKAITQEREGISQAIGKNIERSMKNAYGG
jgi:hypothetical protein